MARVSSGFLMLKEANSLSKLEKLSLLLLKKAKMIFYLLLGFLTMGCSTDFIIDTRAINRGVTAPPVAWASHINH